jgi:hypothetical protein
VAGGPILQELGQPLGGHSGEQLLPQHTYTRRQKS